jgi:GntR family transcriptional regulator
MAVDPAIDSRRAYLDMARAAERQRQHSPRRVHMLLRAAIRAGDLREGGQLVESDLIRDYGSSRQAVRQAMALLAAEGLISRAPRAGTVVVRGISEIALTDAASADAAGVGPQRLTFVTSDDRAVPSTPFLRERLRTTEREVRMAEHLVHVDGAPLCVFTAYSSLAFPARSAAADQGGLAATFREAYGARLRRVETTVQAVSSDERTRLVLGVPDGGPILCRERVLYDADLVPREVGFTYYVGSAVALRSSSDLDP